MDDKTRSYYLELYKLAVEEVHKYHLLHHQRAVYFSGLITTILGAAGLALLKSSAWQHYLFSALVLALLILVCQVGRAGIGGAYRLLLEAISIRAKLEQALHLTTASWLETGDRTLEYWAEEPLIPSRHINDRIEFKKSSSAWQEHRIESSDQRWTDRFLKYAEGLGLALLVVTILLALKSVAP